MEQQLKYEEWFFQSDYDLETAHQLLQSGRNVYCIFMCHLCLEKALNRMAIITRYPEDLQSMIKLFSGEQTNNVYEQTKTVQQWIIQQ